MIFDDVQKDSEQRLEKFEAAIEKKLQATTEKLNEILESFSKSVASVKEKESNLEKGVAVKLVMMEEKTNNHQSQQPEPMRIVSEGTGTLF